MPLVAGRAFTDRDDPTAPKVVDHQRDGGQKYFPNENPIGQRFGSSVEDSGQIEIVGVLRDAKYDSVRDAVPPTMYVPYAAEPAGHGDVSRAHRRRSGRDRRRDPRSGPAGRSRTCR